MMSGEPSAAKIKYQYVVQTFPDKTASSLALQLLENME
jgi:outer membrane protein assembly factor BamD (BamD/ComL family)